MMNNDIPSAFRVPAEWEPTGAVLVAWPHEDTDWHDMLNEVEMCYVDLVKAIVKHGYAVVVAPDTNRPKELLADVESDRIIFFDTQTNDTWTRDYGVISAVTDTGEIILNDFGFNAWGGKFDYDLDNGVTSRMFESGLLRGKYVDRRDFILEGGSIESDGKGTIMTTACCLLTDTRNGTSKDFVENKLKETLGAKRVLWIEKGDIIGDDTDGHVDTFARLAPNDTILCHVASTCEGDDIQASLIAPVARDCHKFVTADGSPYNIIEVPLPDPVYDPEDGHRLPASYLNFLIFNDAILFPTYGQPRNDTTAMQMIRIAFPDYEIEPVDCRALIRQHGSLHCATMQIPSKALPI